MTRELTVVQAVTDALRAEMRSDDSIIVLGEDVGLNGGVFRATEGLQKEFGEARVIDTPLAEAGIIGTSIGMALYGLKAVPEIQFLDFIYPAFDQIVNELAKFRYRSGGQYAPNVTIRAPYGGGIKGGHYHSQSTEAYFAHTAGLKVVVPSNPYDTKGLLIASIRDPDPVMFLEPKRIYRAMKGDVPEEAYTVPLGKAAVAKEGDDVTVAAYGSMLHVALQAAQKAEEQGASAEVLDLRTLVPLDEDTFLGSVRKTGRLVVVHEAQRTAGFGAELVALAAEKAIEHIEAPMVRVTGLDTPFPYALENQYLPDVPRVLDAIQRTVSY
jgi:2-oxoisovalerate dehydrogenase E1 component beta subunit